MSESDDEMPTLSLHALAALNEFKQEEKQRLEKFEKLYQSAEDDYDSRNIDDDNKNENKNEKINENGYELNYNENDEITIDDFKEDWQLSQFWYSDKTASILADELLDGADEDTTICIVSAPSVFAAIRSRPLNSLPTKKIYLFEFDKRFSVLSGKNNFGFYDYNKPLEFRDDLKGKIDRLLIDPPFLEPECQTKSSISAKALLRESSENCKLKTKSGSLKHRLISCTGERMAELMLKTYPNFHITTFYPEHKNGLSNEFRCYADFEGKNWKFEN